MVHVPVFVGEPVFVPYHNNMLLFFSFGGFKTIRSLYSDVQLIEGSFHYFSRDFTSLIHYRDVIFDERDSLHVGKRCGCLEITLVQVKRKFNMLLIFLEFYFPCNKTGTLYFHKTSESTSGVLVQPLQRRAKIGVPFFRHEFSPRINLQGTPGKDDTKR